MENSICFQYYKSPFGILILGSYGSQLCLCDWKHRRMREKIDSRISASISKDWEEKMSLVLESTIEQLDEYFIGTRKVFDLELLFTGTDFQKKVWKALMDIPYGETRSYSQLTNSIGSEKAIRAVSSANGANAISIIVPCHRVIGKNGELVGYAGGLPAKKNLLHLEYGGSESVSKNDVNQLLIPF